MATSDRRNKANQANALKSTGPRSSAGKAASSTNSLQHGILSRHLILPGEDRSEFDALLQQLMSEQQPVGTLEQALVERMAVALWRQRRLVTAESAQVNLRQSRLTLQDFYRVQEISGERDDYRIKMLASEPLPDLAELQAELDECAAWMEEFGGIGAREPDQADFKARFPRLSRSLMFGLDLDAAEASLSRHQKAATSMARRVEDIAEIQAKTLKLVTALQQTRQAAMLPEQSDLLSRYQSSLDNDLYKAMRALREAQRHRFDQAALTARPLSPDEAS